MEKKVIKKIDLKNGLTLNILDESKKIAADRYYVAVNIRIEVPVEKKWFKENEIDDQTLQQYRTLMGDVVLFEQKKERNFVEDSKKEDVVKSLCKSVTDHTVKYFNHKDFAKKLIIKKANDQSASF